MVDQVTAWGPFREARGFHKQEKDRGNRAGSAKARETGERCGEGTSRQGECILIAGFKGIRGTSEGASAET